MFGPRTFKPATHDFFGELATLLISLASLNTATEAFAFSCTTIPNAPDHELTLYGNVADVSFEIHTLMHTVVRNQWPTELQFTLTPASEHVSTSSTGVHLQSADIANVIVQLVGAVFLKYFERNSDRAKSAYGKDQKSWPAEWRFAWLLRNAIAHGDKWRIDDPNFPSTEWHRIHILPADSGTPWFNPRRFVGGGDVILLLEELNASIT